MELVDLGLWLLSFATLWICLKLTWRPGEFPTLAFLAVYQWVELSTALWASAVAGSDVDQFFATGGNVRLAIALGLIATIVVSAGMRLGAGTYSNASAKRLHSIAQTYPLKRYYVFYFGAFVAAFAFELGAIVMPGLSQGFLALANFKWAAFLLLTFAVFRSPGGKLLWTVVLMASMVAGLGGFFSSFKWAFVYGGLGIVAAGVKLGPKRIAVVASIGGLALLAGSVWQAIKVDYRDFVSGGTMQQRVVTDWSDSLAFIYRDVASVTPEQVTEGFRSLVSRVAVVDMFAATLVHIPEASPHTGGKYWSEAITYPLMPRVLFPDKKELDDSTTTMELTGLRVAGKEEGVSISTGYIAEAYADFGADLMFVPILVLGLGIGLIHRLLGRDRDPVRAFVGSAMATIIIVTMASIGYSSIKVISSVLIYTIAALIALRGAGLIFPRPHARLISSAGDPARPPISFDRPAA